MKTRLYATRRGKGTATITADKGDVTSVGDLRWSDHRATFDALKDGDSSVVGEWRVTKLPDFQQGAILFDEHAKEYVKVSNGQCVLDHTDSEAFRRSHNGNTPCVLAPSEAIALRPIIGAEADVYVAWTIRSVNPCDLRPVRPGAVMEISASFEAVLQRSNPKKFKGRI